MTIALKVPSARPAVRQPAAAGEPPRTLSMKLVPPVHPAAARRAWATTGEAQAAQVRTASGSSAEKPAAPSAATPAPSAVDTISKVIDLEIEARQCADLDTLRFAIVNSTRKIAAFAHAFLVEPTATGGWSVTRASSVAKVDRHAPLVRALEAWLSHPSHRELLQRGELRAANIVEEAAKWGLPAEGLAHPDALLVPIKTRDGRVLAGFLALRSGSWMPQHCALLVPLAGAYGHAWDALAPRAGSRLQRVAFRFASKRLALALAAGIAACAFVPVPLAVLAPAEIVATNPLLVTAPIEGVIADILVPPGTWVEKGAVIVKFVDIKLRADLEIAARNKAVASARHFKVVQAATATQKDMQELATAKAEFDLASAEHAYAADLLARAEVRANQSGFLIYSNKSDWVGKPVVVGERLMEIGDPARSEIKIELPVSDVIAVRQGGGVSLFLDGDPMAAIAGTITRTSYRPTLTADQQLAFRIHATVDDGLARRIGQRGVARVKGETVSLWFYLLRRPIASLRQRFGL